MIRRLAILAAIAWTAAMAQSKWPNGLTTTFKDGTHLRIHTESTAAVSPLSTSGTVALGDGNIMHRLVVDSTRRILFGYTVEAWGVPNVRDLYFIRIRPLDPGYEARLPKDSEYRKRPPAGPDGKVPTVAAIRDFSSVRIGEAVSIDILVNPDTGERIYDVIEPATPPEEKRTPVKPTDDEFSLESVRIVVNGKTVQEPRNNWIIGSSAMFYIPGYGTFYVALDPLPEYPFVPSGRVNREVLTFGEGNDWVEVTGKSNVLKKSEYRTVWVYRTRDFQGQQLKEVMVGTADSVSYLIPKKRPAKEE